MSLLEPDMLHQFVERTLDPGDAAAVDGGFSDDIDDVAHSVLRPILDTLEKLQAYLREYCNDKPRLLALLRFRFDDVKKMLTHFEFERAKQWYSDTIAKAKHFIISDIDDLQSRLMEESWPLMMGDKPGLAQIEADIKAAQQEKATVVAMFQQFRLEYDQLMKPLLDSEHATRRRAAYYKPTTKEEAIAMLMEELEMDEEREKADKELATAAAKAAATRIQARKDEEKEREKAIKELASATAKAAASQPQAGLNIPAKKQAAATNSDSDSDTDESDDESDTR